MDTIEQYRAESENERGGWRGALGKVMTFAGFIVFANAFLVALLFRHLLSFRNQVILAVVGGIIGLAGMAVRGNKRELIEPAAFAVVAGIIATVAINLLQERYGFVVMVVAALTFCWLVNRFIEHVDKKL
ncbi:MAG TPA: hypothetical protein VNI02_06970 [Blastocatellia bacterium]|jgi:hypothetical protein|nr:hypothetical protein [Blastocatellia bacterium]